MLFFSRHRGFRGALRVRVLSCSQFGSRLFPRRCSSLGLGDLRRRRGVLELLGEHHALRNVIERESVALHVAHVEFRILLRRRVLLELAVIHLVERGVGCAVASVVRGGESRTEKNQKPKTKNQKKQTRVESATEMDGAFCQQGMFRVSPSLTV